MVLFGATGFTGGLTAEYLARHAPAGLRWALAGRDPQRLAAVRDRLAAIDPALADLPLLTADVTDADSLRAVARERPGGGQHCRPVRPPRGAAGRGLRPGRHRLPGHHRRAGVRRPDVRAPPRRGDPHRRAAGARLRVRLHPARPGRLVHRQAAARRTCRSPWTGTCVPAAEFSAGTYHSALTAFSRTGQASRPPGPAGRSSRARPTVGSGRCPADWPARRSWASGPCRCRPSTRRWSAARPRPARSTARTSATGTSPP